MDAKHTKQLQTATCLRASRRNAGLRPIRHRFAHIVHEATLKLENGNTFTIKSTNPSDKNAYVKSIRLNGKLYEKSYITHADILNGGELVFEMSHRPNRKSALYGKPYSFTK